MTEALLPCLNQGWEKQKPRQPVHARVRHDDNPAQQRRPSSGLPQQRWPLRHR